MPLIECLIEREGPTTINDGGFTFTFKENDAGHKVANVLSDGTADRLLSFKWFRLYNPDVDYAEPEDAGETAPGEGLDDDTDPAGGNAEPADTSEGRGGEPSTAEGDAEPDSNEAENVELGGENGPGPGDTEPADDEETETQTILRLRGTGKSYREIAEVVGKSKTYVSSVVNANK